MRDISLAAAICLSSLFVFLSPTFVLAQSTIPIGQTPLQLVTTLAAVEAEESAMQSGQPLACAAFFSTSTASVGQQVILGWGSAGAIEQTKDTENMWPLEGASTLSFSQTGTWTYPFTFYSASGQNVVCTASIVVR